MDSNNKDNNKKLSEVMGLKGPGYLIIMEFFRDLFNKNKNNNINKEEGNKSNGRQDT